MVHAGAVIVWVGTLLYNSSCITPAILATLIAPLPASTLAAVLQWAVKVPNIVAGCFFVTGSYFAWAAASRSPNLLHSCQYRLPTGSFWAFLLYLLVSRRPLHVTELPLRTLLAIQQQLHDAACALHDVLGHTHHKVIPNRLVSMHLCCHGMK